ncbi:tetratricopeptide repeat protein [Rapidithrix thailandica]|uniref:Tetratricopeptide repeat protein n=1 Tax=Rapidithrix thailandica TaxID=413964 RepID=A0AAW9S8B5_9BACT
MKSQYDLELIEKYLDNALSAKEVEEVNQRLAEDDEFRRCVDQSRLMIHGIRRNARMQLRRKLDEIEESLIETDETKEAKIISLTHSRILVSIAAAVTLLIISTLLIINLPETPQNLYVQYYQPYRNIVTANVRGELQELSKYELAFTAYDSGNYELATNLFKELLAKEATATYLFYLANSYLALEKNTQAAKYFEQVIHLNEDFVDQAKWYLALIALNEKNIEEAKSLLKELKTSGYRSEEVTEILTKL